MNTEKPDQPAANLRRRSFLLTASLGSAGAVATAVVARSPVAPETLPATADAGGSGYQVSDHVLHYYRTTRT